MALVNSSAGAARATEPVLVELAGRFMLPSKEEHDCQIVAMSTSEMLISARAKPDLGDQVIVYVADLGRFEGVVSRHEAQAFAIGMSLAPIKRDKLAEQLETLANRGGDQQSFRRHKRYVPLTRVTTVRPENGVERMARINDISASGVNIEFNFAVAKQKIEDGSLVYIGSKAAKVVRTFEGGFVAQFVDAFEEGAVDERIIL